MDNSKKNMLKIGKLVSTALILFSIMLLPVIASAKMDINIDKNEDSLKFAVKNIGKESTYLLNSLTIINDKGKTIYTSHDRSSAEILRISRDKSYIFEWNTENIPDGKYKAKIYQGDNKRKLEAISIEFQIKHSSGKLIFYTDETFYKYGHGVDITLKNSGKNSIYVNVNNWKIIDLKSKKVVRILSHECSIGYGGCADLFEEFHDEYLEQTWDQKDSKGKQVKPGSYAVTAEYSTKEHPSGKDIKTISTKTFYIRPEEEHHDD